MPTRSGAPVDRGPAIDMTSTGDGMTAAMRPGVATQPKVLRELARTAVGRRRTEARTRRSAAGGRWSEVICSRMCQTFGTPTNLPAAQP
jgi:hypothetical protein